MSNLTVTKVISSRTLWQTITGPTPEKKPRNICFVLQLWPVWAANPTCCPTYQKEKAHTFFHGNTPFHWHSLSITAEKHSLPCKSNVRRHRLHVGAVGDEAYAAGIITFSISDATETTCRSVQRQPKPESLQSNWDIADARWLQKQQYFTQKCMTNIFPGFHIWSQHRQTVRTLFPLQCSDGLVVPTTGFRHVLKLFPEIRGFSAAVLVWIRGNDGRDPCCRIVAATWSQIRERKFIWSVCTGTVYGDMHFGWAGGMKQGAGVKGLKRRAESFSLCPLAPTHLKCAIFFHFASLSSCLRKYFQKLIKYEKRLKW